MEGRKGLPWARPCGSKVKTGHHNFTPAQLTCAQSLSQTQAVGRPRAGDTCDLAFSGLTSLPEPSAGSSPWSPGAQGGAAPCPASGGAAYTEGNTLPSVFSPSLQALEQQQDHRAPERLLPGTAPAGEIVSARAGWGGGHGQEVGPGRVRNPGC